jgi:hypothetical protein
VCVDAPCISFRPSKVENRCTISEHVEDWEERLDAFLENRGEKIGGPKTLAMLAMLAMLLFDKA